MDARMAALDEIKAGSYPRREHYVAIFGFQPNDADFAEWSDAIVPIMAKERADRFKELATELVTGVNRNHTKEVAKALVAGHHPYLLNELMLAVMVEMDKRFGDGGDGRISPLLLDMMKRTRLD